VFRIGLDRFLAYGSGRSEGDQQKQQSGIFHGA
jgi:hypothetical protein